MAHTPFLLPLEPRLLSNIVLSHPAVSEELSGMVVEHVAEAQATAAWLARSVHCWAGERANMEVRGEME